VSDCSGVTEILHVAFPAHALQGLQDRIKSVSNEGHFTLEAETIFRQYLPSHCSGVTKILYPRRLRMGLYNVTVVFVLLQPGCNLFITGSKGTTRSLTGSQFIADNLESCRTRFPTAGHKSRPRQAGAAHSRESNSARSKTTGQERGS
jgi:hypothetical protein